jgi:hypothetical protein
LLRAILVFVPVVLLSVSPGLSAAQAHSPPEVKNPPPPTVGRDAELLPDRGGPVLELFRLRLLERPWLADGVRLGRSTLRLGFAFEGGWQSSVLLHTPWEYRDSDQSTPVLQMVSQVRLASIKPIGTRALRLRYGVQVAVGARLQSAQMDDANPLRNLLDVRASGLVELDFKRRAVLGLEANFARINHQTSASPGVNEVDYFDTRLRLRVPLRGDRMSLGVLYRFAMWQPERAAFASLRQHEHNLQLRLEWRFPFKWRAGFLVEAGYVDFRGAPFPLTYDTYAERRAFPVRSLLRLSGIIGPRLSFTLGIGYGAAVLQWPHAFPARDEKIYHGVVAHLGLAIRLARRLVLSLGLWSDFRTESGVAEVILVDNYFATLTALPYKRLSVQLTVAYVSRRYKLDYPSISSYGFVMPSAARLADRPLTDPNLLVRATVDWYVLPWLSVGASYQLQKSFLDGPIAVPISIDPAVSLYVFRYSYGQHRLLGRVALRY